MIGFLGNILFNRTRIPESLFLITIGVIIGPILNLVNSNDLIGMSSFIATIALIIILLDSGMSMDIRKLLKNFSHATIFTLMVFTLTTFLVSLFLYLLIRWPLSHALLLGVISGGTTTVTVMTLVSRCTVSDDTKNLLFLESMVNDVTLISGAVILIQIMKFSTIDTAKIANLILGSVSIAFLFGFLTALFWISILNKYLEKHPLNYVSTLGIVLILYAFVETVGGNGAIAVLLFSLTVGNFRNLVMRFKIKTDLVTEHSLETLKKIKSIQLGITFFVKTFFFVFLGLIFSFQNLTQEIWTIAFGMIFILLVARFFSAEILSLIDKKYGKETFLITTMLPRGFTATVVAFLPREAGIVIPGLIEIVLLMLFLSTLIAIFGATIYERKFPHVGNSTPHFSKSKESKNNNKKNN
jgi:cell volume regulation protein A